jgi:hypothetical protein
MELEMLEKHGEQLTVETEVLPHTACLIMYNACRARIHLLHPVIRDPCINLPALYPAAAVVQL